MSWYLAASASIAIGIVALFLSLGAISLREARKDHPNGFPWI
ncbi:hypothetical protein C8J32_10421 [Rhizobium sp. PP-CC-3A-592]|nr:hypothetical protein C8J32_10421 [Rhizobium sp. PP-CC-3A-592]